MSKSNKRVNFKYGRFLTMLMMTVSTLFIMSGCASTGEFVATAKTMGAGVIGTVKKTFQKKQDEEQIVTTPPRSNAVQKTPTRNVTLIRDIQVKLQQLGYGAAPTGAFDAKTEAAIQDFQLDHDLGIDGKPSQSLLRMINAQL